MRSGVWLVGMSALITQHDDELESLRQFYTTPGKKDIVIFCVCHSEFKPSPAPACEA